jgi:hypothetical protein
MIPISSVSKSSLNLEIDPSTNIIWDIDFNQTKYALDGILFLTINLQGSVANGQVQITVLDNAFLDT